MLRIGIVKCGSVKAECGSVRQRKGRAEYINAEAWFRNVKEKSCDAWVLAWWSLARQGRGDVMSG